MTDKNTYWIADADGNKALVEGADDRDRWTKVRGWTEASEPEGQEFVWLRNDDPDLGPTRLNWLAAQDPAWSDRGFHPGPPPEPVNAALPPERVARAAPDSPAAAPAPASSNPKPAANATSGKIKE